MSGNPVGQLPLGEIQDLCRYFGVEELAVFGSALGEELGADSDLDFLVRFLRGAEKPWMGHFQQLEQALSRLLGRDVHLVDRKAVEQSRNWIRRRAILESAQILYEAA